MTKTDAAPPAKEGKERPKLISKKTLKSRGWTEGLIGRLFPVPTKEAPNPYYRSKGASMKLYALLEVESIEAGPAWQRDRVIAKKVSSTQDMREDAKQAYR